MPNHTDITAHSSITGQSGRSIHPWWVVAVCTIVMMTEGFDLLIYSNAIPLLLLDAGMGIDKSAAGTIGSMIFLGMLFGGVVAGKTTDLFGLGKTVFGGFVVFTLATAAVCLSKSAWQLGLLRFVAGLGLGVVLPTCLSLARHYAPPRQGALVISIVMSGIAVGGMLAAVVAQYLIPLYGWRSLFLSGGVLGVLVMLCGARQLACAAAAIRLPPPQNGDCANWRAILHGASRYVLLLGALATLADLLTWYGVTVWLTQLMREFEIPLQGALQLMFTLNIGAVVGSLITAALAVRFGARAVAIAAGLMTCLCLLLIASRMLEAGVLFAVIALLGMSAISAQNLLNELVAAAFPMHFRSAAMGVTLGIGRLGAVIAPALGGYILASSYGPSWVFVVFAISALGGVLLVLAFTPQRSKACLEQLS